MYREAQLSDYISAFTYCSNKWFAVYWIYTNLQSSAVKYQVLVSYKLVP